MASSVGEQAPAAALRHLCPDLGLAEALRVELLDLSFLPWGVLEDGVAVLDDGLVPEAAVLRPDVCERPSEVVAARDPELVEDPRAAG